jgi:plasmid stability protein
MPALQVRNFPDNLYEELRAVAKREHRSVAQQTVACVEGYLHSNHVPLHHNTAEQEKVETRSQRRQRLFEEIETSPKFDVPSDFPSIVELVRQDRDSR